MSKDTQTKPSGNGLMTINEFGEWARISRGAIYIEIWDGRLQALKCGRRTLIATQEAQRWLAMLPKFKVRPAPPLKSDSSSIGRTS
jgi:hypothetical protein